MIANSPSTSNNFLLKGKTDIRSGLCKLNDESDDTLLSIEDSQGELGDSHEEIASASHAKKAR